MTKYEKLSVVLSAAAALISLATPALTYVWFDISEKQLINRARLQPVALEYENPLTMKLLSVEIKNIGKLPAKDVQFAILYVGELPQPEIITFYPPAPIETRREANAIYVTMKRAIAPQSTIRATFHGVPGIIYAYTEYGDQTALYLPPNGNPGP